MDLIPTLISNKSQNSNTAPNNSALRIILHEVAEKHGFINGELASKTQRYAPIVAARNEFFYRACTETTESLSDIGRFLGMNHTSAHYGAARYALHHKLPPPRGYSLIKVARTSMKSYPKTLEQARLTSERQWKRDNLDPKYMEDQRGLVILRRRAMRGSAELLTLLRKHHGPLAG